MKTSTPAKTTYRDFPTIIKHKQFKNGEIKPGLYTENGIWIKWLSQAEYDIAISLNVPDLGLA